MVFTPSATSGVVAGAGFWALVWSMVYKIDAIVKPLGLGSFISSAGILEWVRSNKVLTLMITEVINLMMHGVKNANVMAFVLGGTIMNIFMIFAWIPCFAKLGFGKRKKVIG